MSRLATVTGLVATGSSQLDALKLIQSNTVSVVATTPAGSGVLLPAAVSGLQVVVVNSGANPLNVYPQVGATLGLGVNTPYVASIGQAVTLVSTDGLNWVVTVSETSSSASFSSLSVSGTSSLTGAVTMGSTLSMTATSNQIVTASGSAHPTTLSVPGFSQTTAITVPNPHATTATIPIVDPVGLFWPSRTYTFPADVDVTGAAAIGTTFSTAAVSNQFVTSSTTATPTTITIDTMGQATTLSIEDPGVSDATITTSIGLQQGTGVMGDGNVFPNLVPVYPTLLPIPSSTSAPVRIANAAVPGTTAFTSIYTAPAGFFAVLTAASQYNSGGTTAVGNMFVSPDSNVTRYFVSQVTLTTGLGASYGQGGIVLLPGWSLIVQGDGSAGGTAQTVGCSFLLQAITGNFQAFDVTALASGKTTLYTCPTNMQAYILGPPDTYMVGQGGIYVAQQSGGTVNYIYGVHFASTNFDLLSINNGTATRTLSGNLGINRLNAGDSFYVRAGSTQATSHCWFQVYQYSALLPLLDDIASTAPEELKSEETPVRPALPLPSEEPALPPITLLPGVHVPAKMRSRLTISTKPLTPPDSPEWESL